MKFELHCHSHYSRGTKLPTEGIPSPKEIVRQAKKVGLGGIAITDHNVFKAHEAAAEAKKQKILLIPGEEVSTLEGHVLGIGINEFIPPRLSLEETVEKIREQGGIAIAPHPFDIKGEGVRGGFIKCDAVEVFSGLNLDRFSNMIARSKTRGFPQVVGSDAHTLDMVGKCVNITEAGDLDSVLKKIKKGDVTHIKKYAHRKEVMDWAYQRLYASREEAIDYIHANYNPVKKWISLRMLDKYLKNQGGFFTLLSKFGMFSSFWYGGIKAVRHAGT
jgi:predicted metal-dependent phosphoesterase TrpH